MEVDEHNNAVEAKCFVFIDSDDNVIVSHDPNHLISTIGISDMIVVHTKDATLVCPKQESQRVKELLGKVKDKYGNTFL
jgi:mannose-1-phosphate guanylyltransferase